MTRACLRTYRHWNNVTNAYESKRSNHDDKPVPPIPELLMYVREYGPRKLV